MGSEPSSVEQQARLAAIVEALHDQFGTDALRVAEAQAGEASGATAAVWLAVVDVLRRRVDGVRSNEV